MDNKFDWAKTVSNAQCGDKLSLGELYRESWDSVYYMALRILRNPHDAFDISQETFITAFDRLKELKEPAAFKKWIGRIVYTKCLNFMKKDKVETVELEQYENFSFNADEEFLPESVLASAESRKQVIDAVDRLTEKQRLIVMLYYFEGYSLPEIAQITEISESAVCKRLHDARSMLKAKLQKQGSEVFSIALPLLSIIFKDDMKLAVTEELKASACEQFEPFLEKASAKLSQNGSAQNPAKASIVKRIVNAAVAAVIITALFIGVNFFSGQGSSPTEDFDLEEIIGSKVPLSDLPSPNQPSNPETTGKAPAGTDKEEEPETPNGTDDNSSAPHSNVNPDLPEKSDLPSSNTGNGSPDDETDIPDENTPLDDLPAGTDPDGTGSGNEPGNGTGTNPGGNTGSSFQKYITVESLFVSYKKGNTVSIEKICEDAKITIKPNSFKLVITGYDKIDFNRISEYAIGIALYDGEKMIEREFFAVRIV